MKTLKLSLGFILNAHIASFSQAAYDPIISESKLWSSLSGGFGSMMVECCYQTTFVKLESDASTAGASEKKVLVSRDSLKTWANVGGITEIGKKVYFHDSKNMKGLVYDFGATEGEVLNLANYCDNAYIGEIVVKISRIDTISYQEKKRKRLWVTHKGWPMDSWIEGIGGAAGLFNSCVGMTGGFRELLCVQDSHSLVYQNLGRGTCYKSDSRAGVDKNTIKDFKLYVANSNGRLKVDYPAGNVDLSYSIHGLAGQEVGFGRLSGKWIDANLKAGVYVLRIIGDDRLILEHRFVIAM